MASPFNTVDNSSKVEPQKFQLGKVGKKISPETFHLVNQQSIYMLWLRALIIL